jgi:flagellar hook-associated protein 3 FlgL
VLDRINNNPDNAPPIITAQLARVGNGIELIDSSFGSGSLSVRTAEGSIAAQHLGFVAAGQTQSSSSDTQIEGSNLVLQSEDRNPLETESVFNTLIRLRTAIEQNDEVEIGRTLERLDNDLNRLNFSQAEIGGRLQNLKVIGDRLEDENVQLKSALSDNIDVDLIEAISQLTARQYAFEASLRSSASLMQMSLLNFL